MIVPGRARIGYKWVNRESVLKVRFLGVLWSGQRSPLSLPFEAKSQLASPSRDDPVLNCTLDEQTNVSPLVSKFGRTCDTIVAPLARQFEADEKKRKTDIRARTKVQSFVIAR
jgi:hypothetical protein